MFTSHRLTGHRRASRSGTGIQRSLRSRRRSEISRWTARATVAIQITRITHGANCRTGGRGRGARTHGGGPAVVNRRNDRRSEGRIPASGLASRAYRTVITAEPESRERARTRVGRGLVALTADHAGDCVAASARRGYAVAGMSRHAASTGCAAGQYGREALPALPARAMRVLDAIVAVRTTAGSDDWQFPLWLPESHALARSVLSAAYAALEGQPPPEQTIPSGMRCWVSRSLRGSPIAFGAICRSRWPG